MIKQEGNQYTQRILFDRMKRNEFERVSTLFINHLVEKRKPHHRKEINRYCAFMESKRLIVLAHLAEDSIWTYEPEGMVYRSNFAFNGDEITYTKESIPRDGLEFYLPENATKRERDYFNRHESHLISLGNIEKAFTLEYQKRKGNPEEDSILGFSINNFIDNNHAKLSTEMSEYNLMIEKYGHRIIEDTVRWLNRLSTEKDYQKIREDFQDEYDRFFRVAEIKDKLPEEEFERIYTYPASLAIMIANYSRRGNSLYSAYVSKAYYKYRDEKENLIDLDRVRKFITSEEKVEIVK